MWLSSPVFGVGLNNFVVKMEEFGQVIATYRFLQPVHNVFLLILAETGLVGLGLAAGGWRLAFKQKLSHSFSNPKLYILCAIFFLSLFDHYLLTIQQGTLVLGLVMGLALTKVKS